MCHELQGDVSACLWGCGFGEAEDVDRAQQAVLTEGTQGAWGRCLLCAGSQEACLEVGSVVSSPGKRVQLLQDEGIQASEKV